MIKPLLRNFLRLSLILTCLPFVAVGQINIPSLEEYPLTIEAEIITQLSKPNGVFVTFDRVRVRASHPMESKSVSTDQRVEAYRIYVEDLRRYGLLPQNETSCLFSLLPPQDSTPAMGQAPVATAQTIFSTFDPCFPKVEGLDLERQGAWQIEDILKKQKRPPNDPRAPMQPASPPPAGGARRGEGSSTPPANENGKTGKGTGNGGGVGRAE